MTTSPLSPGLLPSVGVVIVNFNGGDKILHCIRALQDQVVPLREIVVVDNGSADGSVARIRSASPSVRVIELGENRGLPLARNVGLRALDAQLALSIDSDVYVTPDCLEKLVRAQLLHGAALVCPRVVFFPENAIVQCDGALIHFLGTLALRHASRPEAELPAAGAFVGGFIGACILVDREVILRAGGFDELFFFYFEDLELSFKLRARGYRLFCESAAVVHHDRGQGTPGLSFRSRDKYPTRRAYLTMRHRWLVILIHYRARTIAVLSPALLCYELATLATSIARGWLGAWARGWWWLAVNGRPIGRRRRLSQAARTVADRDLLEGGAIPLAPGFVVSGLAQRSVAAFSALLDLYWRGARKWIG